MEILRRTTHCYAKALTAALLSLVLAAPCARASGEIETSGDLLQLALPAAAFGLTFANEDQTGAIQFAQAGTATAITTQALKLAIDKKRPDGHGQAFPSGHTSISFASAEFIRKRYGGGYGLPAYAVASYVGWTRIHAKRHDIVDVTAGALLGAGFAHSFTEEAETISFLPLIGDRFAGFSLNGRW